MIADGFPLPAASVDAVLLFNILHAEDPMRMLRASSDLLRPGGRLLVIHWRSDLQTPRGPDRAIRPHPAQIVDWAKQIGGLDVDVPATVVPPWHYALSFLRTPRVPG